MNIYINRYWWKFGYCVNEAQIVPLDSWGFTVRTFIRVSKVSNDCFPFQC